jgi:hypothetical protein
MGQYSLRTIEAVAELLGCHPLTPREIAERMPHHFSIGSARQILARLVHLGRAEVTGDITQRRYRRASSILQMAAE